MRSALAEARAREADLGEGDDLAGFASLVLAGRLAPLVEDCFELYPDLADAIARDG
jgi:hypothetical protein